MSGQMRMEIWDLFTENNGAVGPQDPVEKVQMMQKLTR